MENHLSEIAVTILVGIIIGTITNIVAHLLAVRRNQLQQTVHQHDDSEKPKREDAQKTPPVCDV